MKWRSIVTGALCVLYTVPSLAQANDFACSDIISFAPLVTTEGTAYGSGLSWEHFLNEERWLSFELAASGTVNANSTDDGTLGQMFYFTPGIKLYTNLRSSQRMKFSIGPSLLFGTGQGKQSDYTGPAYIDREQTRTIYGFMVVGGLNWFPTPHIYLGTDYGFGVTELNMYDGSNHSVSVLSHLTFKIGYRFSTHRATTNARMDAPAPR